MQNSRSNFQHKINISAQIDTINAEMKTKKTIIVTSGRGTQYFQKPTNKAKSCFSFLIKCDAAI